MATIKESLAAFLDGDHHVALVEVARAKGSTPREEGARMLVSPTSIHGTIGGGQLEFMAIDKAREMLRSSPSPLRGGSIREAERGGGGSAALDSAQPPPGPSGKGDGKIVTLDVPLGPEIGQCCGGR